MLQSRCHVLQLLPILLFFLRQSVHINIVQVDLDIVDFDGALALFIDHFIFGAAQVSLHLLCLLVELPIVIDLSLLLGINWLAIYHGLATLLVLTCEHVVNHVSDRFEHIENATAARRLLFSLLWQLILLIALVTSL